MNTMTISQANDHDFKRWHPVRRHIKQVNRGQQVNMMPTRNTGTGFGQSSIDNDNISFGAPVNIPTEGFVRI